MSLKDWKNKELTSLLSEAWGFKFNTLQEFDEFNGTGEAEEEEPRNRAVEPPGGWPTPTYPRGREQPLLQTVPVGEEPPKDKKYDEKDLLAMQLGIPPEEMEEASNPRAGNEDRQRPGRNPADRMHEAEKEEDGDDDKKKKKAKEEPATPYRAKGPRGSASSGPGIKGVTREQEEPTMSEAQLSALVREAIKKALTTLQKG